MHPNTNNTPGTLRQLSLAIALALPVLGVSPLTLAAGNQTQQFNIPAQPLADALNAFIATSDWQVGFPAGLARDVRANPVYGNFTPQQALDRLVAGKGLAVQQTGGSVTLVKTAVPVAVAAATTSAQSAETLPTVKVTGKTEGEDYDSTDPYSKNYSIPNARTATKMDIPIMDTPVSIQVVPKSVMNDQQDIRIEDALTRNVSGVQREYVTANMYESFIIRGFGTNDKIYRNGIRRFLGLYDPANIEQLEVLKGPASVLYGRVEPGGMVNYVTKKALDIPYYSLQQQFGSYGEYRTTVDATGSLDKDKTLLYRFNGSYLNSESFRDFNDRERVFIAPKLTWRPNDRFEANVELEKRHDDYLDDFGIPVVGNRPAPVRNSLWTGDPAFRSSSDNTLVAADWSFSFNDDWKINNKFQWDETDNTFGNLFTPFMFDNQTAARVAILGTSNRRTYTSSLDLTGKFQTYGVKHNVLLGGDYFFFNQDAPDNKRIFPFMGYIPPINIYNPQYGNIDWAGIDSVPANLTWRSRDEWFGVYFQDQITLWDKLHILGGGRYDMAGYGGYGGDTWEATKAGFSMQHEDKFSPRVGLVYQPWQWLSLYGNYVESFGTNNGRSNTGLTFAPQESEQYEVGFKTEFFDKKLSSTVAFYNLTKTNILVSDLSTPLDTTDQLAIGEARSRGIEVDIKGQLTERLNLIATYAYTDTRVTKGNSSDGALEGNKLPWVPDNQASLWGTYQFTERFKAGLGGVAVGERQGNAANNYQLPGYVRMDVMAAYVQPIGKSRLTAQININNLLDKEYFTGSTSWLPTANIGAPISAMGSLKLEY